MVGFYDTDEDGGSVTITEAGAGDARIPILLPTEHAVAWLEAKQWDAIPGLGRAPRVRYVEADLFEGKRLATDARTTVPLRRAA